MCRSRVVRGDQRIGSGTAHDSEVTGDFPEFVHRVALTRAEGSDQVLKAVIQVVLDQGLLGLLDRFLHRLQLLRHIKTGAPLLQHVYRAAQVSIGPAQALDDGRVGGMCVRLFHVGRIPSGGLL